MPKVISRNSLNELFKRQVKTLRPPAEYYGYGWFINEMPGGANLISHGGETLGVNCFRTRVSDENLTIVVFSTTTPVSILTPKIWAYLFRNGIVPMPKR